MGGSVVEWVRGMSFVLEDRGLNPGDGEDAKPKAKRNKSPFLNFDLVEHLPGHILRSLSPILGVF